MALESHLRRAGYVFHTGEPLFETLEETKKALSQTDLRQSEMEPEDATAVETAESNKT
jgi:hypothetical protein